MTLRVPKRWRGPREARRQDFYEVLELGGKTLGPRQPVSWLERVPSRALPGRSRAHIGALGEKAAGRGAFEDSTCRTDRTDEKIGRFQQVGAFRAEDIVIFKTGRFRLGKFAG